MYETLSYVFALCQTTRTSSGCATTALPLLYHCFYSYLDRFTTAFLMLRLLYYCFTPTTGTTSGCATAKSLYYFFTTALLLLYYCFTTALLILNYCFTTALLILYLLQTTRTSSGCATLPFSGAFRSSQSK